MQQIITDTSSQSWWKMNGDKGEVLGGADLYHRTDVKGEASWLYSNKYIDTGNIITLLMKWGNKLNFIDFVN